MSVFALFRRREDQMAAAYGEALYHHIVAAARNPQWFARYNLPDTVDGRFDAIALHASLVMHRLAADNDDKSRDISQAIFDAMFRDMDISLREMGVGDVSIPKHFRRMTKAYNGRLLVYHTALQAGDKDSLATALLRNVYREDTARADDAASLADYVLRVSALLAGQATDAIDIKAGQE